PSRPPISGWSSRTRCRIARMARSSWFGALALVAGLLAVTPRASAEDFFSSSPGPLSREHAALDRQDSCNDCHVDGSKALSPNKCLGCHDHADLKARIDAGKGYHASASVRGRKCETCHL